MLLLKVCAMWRWYVIDSLSFHFSEINKDNANNNRRHWIRNAIGKVTTKRSKIYLQVNDATGKNCKYYAKQFQFFYCLSSTFWMNTSRKDNDKHCKAWQQYVCARGERNSCKQNNQMEFVQWKPFYTFDLCTMRMWHVEFLRSIE